MYKFINIGGVCDCFDTYACNLVTQTGMFHLKIKIIREMSVMILKVFAIIAVMVFPDSVICRQEFLENHEIICSE